MTKFNDKDEPERIYIQNWGSGGDETWCSDRINDADDECPDIEYVHIDIVKELIDACCAAVTWRGLDGDGISDPVRKKIYVAIAKAKAE